MGGGTTVECWWPMRTRLSNEGTVTAWGIRRSSSLDELTSQRYRTGVGCVDLMRPVPCKGESIIDEC